MEAHFDWQKASPPQGRESFLPPPDRVGWWLVVSLLTAIILHIILFFALGHIKMGFGWTSTEEVYTEPVIVRPVEEEFPLPESVVEPDVEPPKPLAGKLVDELDVLPMIEDPELEMRPDVSEAAYDIDIKLASPALSGDPAGDVADLATAAEISAEDLETLGKTESFTPTAAEGQMIVDPGSDLAKIDNLDNFMRDLIKKGSNGIADNGRLDGTSTLDEMAGLPLNVLVNSKTLLPGDLLFEFNNSNLRDSSKVGIQKIAYVMDINPNLHCWIDGHTDLIGGDAPNYELSLRRAQSVKSHLVNMGLDPNKIHTRGIGRNEPIVLQGNQDEQSINRRVEIRMRKSPPPPSPAFKPSSSAMAPPKAMPVSDEPSADPAPRKAILVKPQRALPVEEELPPVPVARPAMEDPPAPRAGALPEETDPPAARIVEEAPPLRAEAVEE